MIRVSFRIIYLPYASSHSTLNTTQLQSRHNLPSHYKAIFLPTSSRLLLFFILRQRSILTELHLQTNAKTLNTQQQIAMKPVNFLPLLAVLAATILINAAAVLDPTTPAISIVTRTENRTANIHPTENASSRSVNSDQYQRARKERSSSKSTDFATRFGKRAMGTPTIIAIFIASLAAISLIVACIVL